MIFNPIDTTPYIGLRPFTEDDSIYFKGRDEHILQITALLEQNKFLMVTGASGDGKSSLIYAGLVPNARAGFFKAAYPNWVVADFRPERSPLKNLSRSISKHLRISNDDLVEIELRRGFSSLVELYKSNSLSVDATSRDWADAGEEQRDQIQRSAANLLIVCDQFEEFFTNPENYYRNQPSADSQLVINLLLETTRIAIEKHLPIYIVCTMRSDYVGQCASFRGLPEFIGFSQFFVPRLKRKDIIEVVREPARLHGDRISNRLVERVVYDLGEGIDQLPVLQHAMNEVWMQADHGKAELDLLYYAMAGGMAAKDLPREDREKFEEWFRVLPQAVQGAYHMPGLSRIIDTHANKLFLSAARRYNERYGENISDDDAELVIKTAFVSLTKMDEGRAVRNRMTLLDIVNIIARPHLGIKTVGGVLNIFREQGNTFLRPYITDDPETLELKPGDVLDITHESLIRNWELLTNWAKQEHENLVVYLDFKKQLDRWIESGKSRGFLLSIGQLTYFEAWYAKLKPNAYWINRYLDPGIAPDIRMSEAEKTITDAREFLKKSAGRHRFTRSVVRYGAAKIIAVTASIAVLAICVYFFISVQKRQNHRVIERIISDAAPLLKDPRVDSFQKAVFVIETETIHPNSFRKTLAMIEPEQRLKVCSDIYTEFAWTVIKADVPLRKTILHYVDSVLNTTATLTGATTRLGSQNLLIAKLTHQIYFIKDSTSRNALKRSVATLHGLVMDALVKNIDASTPNMNYIDDGLENLLNNNALSSDDVDKILQSISPFENEKANARFNRICPPTKQVNYARGGLMSHNGGYQELAYLYATQGNLARIRQCLDTLQAYNPRYLLAVNNPVMIAAYLLKAQHEEQVVELMRVYASKRNMPSPEGYEQWLNNSGIFELDFSNKLWVGENHNIVLAIADENTIRKVFQLYEQEIQHAYKNEDDLHYYRALMFKHKGILLEKMRADGHSSLQPAELKGLFDLALSEFTKVSKAYLETTRTVYVFGKAPSSPPAKVIFNYPDHAQRVWNGSFFVPGYYSPAFFHYLLDNKRLAELTTVEAFVRGLTIWLERYWIEQMTSSTLGVEKNFTHMTVHDLERIDSLVSLIPSERVRGRGDFGRLLLIHEYLADSNYAKADAIYKKLDISQLHKNLDRFIGSGIIYQVNSFAPLMNELAAFLASQGRMDEANAVMAEFTNRLNLVTSYADASRRTKMFPAKVDNPARVLNDSVITIVDRVSAAGFNGYDPRTIAVYSLSADGNPALFGASEKLVKQVSIDLQSDVVQSWIHGIASSGQYYTAYNNIPDLTILTDRLLLYDEILLDAALKVADPAMKSYLENKKEFLYQEDYAFDQRVN